MLTLINTHVYAKVFGSMFDGTLRGRSDALLVFINLLARADREGFVDRHFNAISDETGLSRERVKAALIELESPDPESRSQDLEGRRIERIDTERSWGWRIVNYVFYRSLRDEEERREQNRTAQARARDRRRSSPVSSDQPPVSNNQHASAESAHAEAEAEVDAEAIYQSYPRHVARAAALKAIRAAMKKIGKPIALLEKVKAYAVAVKDTDPCYIPYPATWFNQERYNDDPAEWCRRSSPSSAKATRARGEFASNIRKDKIVIK